MNGFIYIHTENYTLHALRVYNIQRGIFGAHVVISIFLKHLCFKKKVRKKLFLDFIKEYLKNELKIFTLFHINLNLQQGISKSTLTNL